MAPRAPNTIGGVKAAARSSKVAQLWEGLERAHTSMTSALERDMVPEAGMPLAWYEVLVKLSRAPGGVISFPDLAELPRITTTGASPHPWQTNQRRLIPLPSTRDLLPR